MCSIFEEEEEKGRKRRWMKRWGRGGGKMKQTTLKATMWVGEIG
jgi:hypothetical protein